MKKNLLSIVFLVGALSSVYSLEPNPYAYNLYTTDYDEANYKVTLHFSTSALAKAIKIYAIDQLGNEYLMRQYGETRPDGYQTIINLFDLMAAGAPPGEELSWRVDCYGENITQPTTCGKRIDFNNPYSIDVDRNPNSPYFGTILITQASNASSSYKRGIKKFNPKFVQEGDVSYIDPDVKLAPVGDSWFYNTHVTPFRVRMLQDGTGRVFVSSADYQQPTYMWTTNLANLNDWTSLFASSEIVTLTNHPAKENTMANCNFDLRKNANGQLEMLLLSGSLDANTDECAIGYPYSGVYTFNMTPTTLEKVGYTVLSESPDGNPHSFIKNIFVGSLLTGNAMFDPNGGVWYSSYSSSAEIDKSSLIHRNTQGEFVQDYVDGNYLKRWATAGGGMRYNSDFTQMVVAQGATSLSDEIRIYNVDHSTSHPTLSGGVGVSLVSGTRSNTMHILDMAWDYASNIYVCSRNANDADLRGVWVVATPLGGKPVATTAREQFRIPCEPGNQYTVSVECNPVEAGSITCTSPNGARVAGVVTVESCTPITLTAVPDANFQFVNWTDESGKEVSTSAEYTFYVVKNTNLTANFKYANYTGVTWWNLFKDGEDIYDSEIDTKRNARLYYLFMAYYNAGSGAGLRWAAKMDDGSGEYNLVNSCYKYADELLNENSSAPMYWLGEYLKSVVKDGYTLYVSASDETANTRWGQTMYAFINRVGYAKNPYSEGHPKYTSPTGLINAIKAFAPVSSGGEGKGEYSEWRPWWTNLSCGLPNSLKYNDALPVEWTMQSAPYNTYDTYANNTVPGNYQPTKTPKWYKWNTAPDGKTYDQSQYLLAWRDGADGPIVHHASRSNMALYASYVDKVLQESDPNPIGEYDATNNDVLSLLNNKNYGATAHNVTMDRKFAGGMYNTICLPFDLPITHLPAKLQGADIRVFDGVTETYTESGDPCAVLNFITLDEYWDKWNAAHPDKQVANDNRYIEAGKPYLIKPSSDVNDEYLTYSGLPYWRFFDGTRTPYGISANGVTFQGVLNPATLPENAYILVADNRIAKVTDTSDKILGYRGYFVINDMFLRNLADQGNVYFSMKKPVTTSIPVAPEAEQQLKPEVRKVMYDGKIYILRGDEVYTITGHRVK